jgi:hypothetical protein
MGTQLAFETLATLTASRQKLWRVAISMIARL